MASEIGPSDQELGRSGEISVQGLLAIPVEISLKIFGFLDLRSVFNLAGASKDLKRMFDVHGESLILSILEAEVSPFDVLLQYIVSRPEDLNVRWGPCLRRRIYHRGKLVSEGETPSSGQEVHVLLPPVMLDHEHFQGLVRTYRTVKAWEQSFPQYRFRDCPSDCRELRPREAERLRRALYHLMSYARYFHSDCPRPNRFIPEQGSNDIRCKKLRLLSSVELCELNDLWQTIVSIVQLHICPSTEQVMLENVSWNPVDDQLNQNTDGKSARTVSFPYMKRRTLVLAPPAWHWVEAAGTTCGTSISTAASTAPSWTHS